MEISGSVNRFDRFHHSSKLLMIPRLIEAHHVRDYVIRLKFQDGAVGEVNLEPQLYDEIFEPLKAPEYFRLYRVDPELHTLTWPNGADFAPEFLYEKAQIPA
jgi:hypothetical protein